AVESDPDDIDAHRAFFNSLISLPADFIPPTEVLAAQQSSLAFLMQQRDGGVQALPMDEELAGVTDLLRKRRTYVTRLQSLFKENNVPFAFFAKQAGIPLYVAWRDCLSSKTMPLRITEGSSEGQKAEVAIAGSGKAV